MPSTAGAGHESGVPNAACRMDGCTIAPQPNTASGERLGAESVAIATDPRNLIRLVPAKEAGPSTR